MKKQSKPPHDIQNSIINYESKRLDDILSLGTKGGGNPNGPVVTRKLTKEERVKYGIDKE